MMNEGTVEVDGTEYIFEPEELETKEDDEGGKVIWPPQEGENQ